VARQLCEMEAAPVRRRVDTSDRQTVSGGERRANTNVKKRASKARGWHSWNPVQYQLGLDQIVSIEIFSCVHASLRQE
jgi:hypothetical protein